MSSRVNLHEWRLVALDYQLVRSAPVLGVLLCLTNSPVWQHDFTLVIDDVTGLMGCGWWVGPRPQCLI